MLPSGSLSRALLMLGESKVPSLGTGQSFDKFFLKFGWVRPRHKFRANLGLWPDFRAEATLWAKF